MGAYLSEPMTEKQSEEGEGNKVKFGACSMQGWRVSQEDAHNCIAKFDEDSSLFAVYDGHGGAEVAIYLSRHLPDMLKACVAYKNGEFIKALEECYLKIDASIKTPEVLQEIQKIAKKANDSTAEADEANLEEAAVDYEKENVAALYEEATMPIEDLVAKYQSGNGGDPAAAGVEEDPNCRPGSSKSIAPGGPGGSSSSAAGSSPGASTGGSSSSAAAAGSSSSSSTTPAAAGGSSSASVKVNGESSSDKPGGSSSEVSSSESKTETNSNELIVEGKKIVLEIPKAAEKEEISEEKSKQGKEEVVEGSSSTSPSKSAEASSTEAVNGSTEDVKVSENGVKSKSVEGKISSSEAATATIPTENGETKPTVNGGSSEEATPAAAAVPSTPESTTPRRKKTHPQPVCIPKDEEKEEARRSSPRKSRQSPSASMDVSDSDESDEDDAGYNVEDDSDSSDDEEEDLGDDSDDDEDEYDDDDAEEDENFLNQMQEPGYDSGATAVVCFMKWGDNGKLSLYVANAGDSRCVVCREGKAVDMSHDHKPELEEEAQRIVNAGGKVTEDGRVNGGLNLSRALGDHSYKTNEELPAEEQMISPLPSVEQIVLEPGKDKFVVLACDGIWNSMGSQEVVDFVGERLQKKEKLSKICEQLFDNCLAPDTHGDGTGCDNMTCIIVQLNETTQAPEIFSGSKRKLSSEEDNALNPDEAESVKKSRLEVSE